MALDPPILNRRNISQSQAEIFIQGEKKALRVKLYTYDDLGELVIPTTLTVTDETVDIYLTTDKLNTLVLSDVPTQTDMLDPLARKSGVLLEFFVDTSLEELNPVGYYAVIFNYTLDSTENRKVILYFNVVSLGNPLLPE